MRIAASGKEKTPTTYGTLARRFMPRPLHDEADYRSALAVLDSLAGHELNADQEDYFDAIATIVEKYESERHPVGAGDSDARALLRCLMDEHGMTASDLGRVLGDRSLGCRVLAGEWALSKTHIRTLANRFALDPAAFLRS